MESSRSKKTSRAPVLLTVFNRPLQTAAVFEAIREARPPRLYLAADGPRSEADFPAVDEARRAVLDGIDWDCEVETLLRPKNLGLQKAMREAITWFFDNEEQGIVLEDDCLPGRSFFPFCEELLARYRADPRVMHISGTAFLPEPRPTEMYGFSIYPQIYGWATWAREWSEYPLDVEVHEEDFAKVAGIFRTSREYRYWSRVTTQFLEGKIESWSLPWCLRIWESGGLAVVPTVALVRNIGFTASAVNTKIWKDYRGWRDWETVEITEVEHPERVERDEDLDLAVFDATYRKPALVVRMMMAVRIIVSQWMARALRRMGVHRG
jgi:hypothetical protein